MASLHKHPRSDNFSVKFRFGGKPFYKSLKTAKPKEAERLQRQIERTLTDMEEGRLILPEGADFWAFILSDGKLTARQTAPLPSSLADLLDAYFAGQVGQKEATP